MADPCHGIVVGRAVHQHGSGAADANQSADPFDVGAIRCLPGHDHPRAVDEQVGTPGLVSAGIEPGHRMTAYEAQAGGVGTCHQGCLGARHVRDHRAGPERAGPAAGEVPERGQAGGRGAGQHDQVGVKERPLRRGRSVVDHPVGEGCGGTASRR